MRDQVDDGIGRAAHRHRTVMAFSKALRVWIGLRRQILPDHLDDAPAAFGGHARMGGVGGGDRRGARQRHAEHLGMAVMVAAVPMVMQVP
jgi:hypothetical protein